MPTNNSDARERAHVEPERLPMVLREHVVAVLQCESEPHVIEDAVAIVKQAADALAFAAAPRSEVPPVDMLLFCPKCGLQHIDEPDERTPDGSNPPHRSHLCHGCGCIWRPADVPTNGVVRIATQGKADTWGESNSAALAAPQPSSASDRREAIARIAALHGLGTCSGLDHRGPPNASWTQAEWEKRILECVPERVEQQCFELADAILAAFTPDAGQGVDHG
jgi:hypothetical protein